MKTKTNKGIMTILTAILLVGAFTFVLTACGDGGGGTTDPCAGGHTWGAYTQITPPNCTEAGIKTRACTICSAADPVTETGDAALEHDFEITESTTSPTCTATGLGSGYCKRNGCTETITNGVLPINSTAHNYQFTSPVAPTCTVGGYDLYTCSHNSAHTEQRNLTAVKPHGHIFTGSHECSLCNHSYAIGDTGPGGGKIYYVADGQYGRSLGFTVEGYGNEGVESYFETYTAYYLEAAPADISDIQWGDYGILVLGITTTTIVDDISADTYEGNIPFIGQGRKDTLLIVDHMNQKSITGTAAQVCVDYRGPNNLDDWFLPSLSESALYFYSPVTAEKPNMYWRESSSQFDNNTRWRVHFGTSNRDHYQKNSNSMARAIRAF